MNIKIIGSSIIAAMMITGCGTAYHRESVQDSSTDRMTVGTVQRSVVIGMSGAEVAQVLGSPNIVSTDENRNEIWIYDKIATDVAYSTSSGGLAALVFGFGSGAGGGGLGSFGMGSGAKSQSQRTLTVIIKFDENKKVRDFAYHTSRF